MGCCQSDTVPDLPDEIKPDPKLNGTVEIITARLGYFGNSRDYGIWDGFRPDNQKEANKKLWLWFNKGEVEKETRVELENFTRDDPNIKNKGRILYYATLQKKPEVSSFRRSVNNGTEEFFGFFVQKDLGSTYNRYEDEHYFRDIPNHKPGHDIHAHHVHKVVTKWQFHSSAKIFDGNTGRGADNLRKDHVLLDVCSVGTIATVYHDWKEKVEIRNDEGRVTGHRDEHRHDRREKNFVDRLEYRLTVNGALWAQWSVPGDAPGITQDVNIDSPFFKMKLEGGWATRTKNSITTKEGMDPAMAMLLAHLCSTEFSVEEVKHDLGISTPNQYHGNMFSTHGSSYQYTLPPTNGVYTYVTY
jgi:hypothetical protein